MTRQRRSSLVLMVALVLIGTGAFGVRAAEPQRDVDPALRAYLSGNGFLNRGLYELAVAEYRSFLAQQRNHAKAPIARYGLAVALFRMKQYEPAIAELTRLHGRRDFEYAAEVGTLLGQSHLARKAYEQAAEAFARVVDDHRGHDLADDAASSQAEALYLDGRYDEAIAAYERFLSRWPKSKLEKRGRLFLGLARMSKQDYGPAAQSFDRLLEHYPKSAFADRASLLLAQCHQHNNALERAARAYRAVLQRAGSPYIPDALLGLGVALQQLGEAKEAGRALDRLLEKFPNHALTAAGRLQRGRTWFEQERFDRAYEQFERVARTEGALRDDAWYWMAKCRLRQNKPTDAARRLAEAINAYPRSALRAEMDYDYGIALLRAGDRKGAGKALQTFRSRHPTHGMAAQALEALATLAHGDGRYGDSQEHCRAFLEMYPTHDLTSRIAFLAAENEFLRERYAQAVKAYEQFVRAYPKDPRRSKARLRLGTALYRLERFEEAEPALASIVERAVREPIFRPALLMLGDLHFRRGEWKNAERRLSEYVSRNRKADSADDALLKLGLARQRQKRYGEALRAYDDLIQRFGKSPHRLHAMFERGQTLLALEKHAEAGKAFEQVLAAGRDSRFAPHALNHLATLALRDGNLDEAAERFEQVARTASTSDLGAEALYQQAEARMAAGQFKQAEAAFAQLIKRHASHARALPAQARRAIALSRQDRYADAVRVMDELGQSRIAKLDTGLRTALTYERAWCLAKLGKTSDAAAAYRAVLDADDDPNLTIHALLELAEIEFKAKRYAAATTLLERLRRRTEKDASAVPASVREQGTYRLAVCAFETGNLEKAATLFEALLDTFPKSPLAASASFFCGEALFQTGRHKQAAGHLDRAASRFPNDPACGPSLLRLGECMAVLQDWSKSERAFAEYLKRFGEQEHWYQAQFGVGWARENRRHFDEAIKAYELVVARHQGPTAARAQFQIGECLFAKKRYDEAIRALLKVDILYAYAEWSAAALYEAGRCFEHLGKPSEARGQFKTVAEKHATTRWAQLASQRLAALNQNTLPGR